MERDFKLELKELKQNETPDLWNRIEAGLSERRAPKKQVAWRNWGILAAACLCVVILFPVVMIRLTGSSKSGSTGYTASYEEKSDGFMNGAADTNADTEAGMAFDMAETSGDMAEAAGESAATAAEEPDVALSGLEMFDLTDGQILEEAVVRILRVDAADGQDIYTAIVEESDADNILMEEMQIFVICDGDSEYTFPRGARDETALKTEKSYSVTLRYEAEYGQDGQDGSVVNTGDFVFYAVTVSAAEEKNREK